jgi:hypothetical protein
VLGVDLRDPVLLERQGRFVQSALDRLLAAPSKPRLVSSTAAPRKE